MSQPKAKPAKSAERKTLNISKPAHMNLSTLVLAAQKMGLSTNKQGLMEGMISYVKKNPALLKQLV